MFQVFNIILKSNEASVMNFQNTSIKYYSYAMHVLKDAGLSVINL